MTEGSEGMTFLAGHCTGRIARSADRVVTPSCRDPQILKGGGLAEDNLSAPSSFIANAQNKIMPFARKNGVYFFSQQQTTAADFKCPEINPDDGPKNPELVGKPNGAGNTVALVVLLNDRRNSESCWKSARRLETRST